MGWSTRIFSFTATFLPSAWSDIIRRGQRGTGYFSRRFAETGLKVTGLDPNSEMNAYASKISTNIHFIQGSAQSLPFADNSFDYYSATTSLCFVNNPEHALAEMCRVSRKAVLLGLLNQHSLLYYMKRNSKGYQDAR